MRWEKAWKRLKKLFQQEQKRRRERVSENSSIVTELQRIRDELTVNHDPVLIRRLTFLEAELRRKDRVDAIVW